MNRFLPKINLQTRMSLSRIIVLVLTIFVSACSEHDMNSEIILIEEDGYMYPAKVTQTYAETDSRIQVYIFNDTIREKIGDWIPTSKLAAKRPKPIKGWGTQQVALQYFWNETWIYAEDVTEFETHYLIPIDTGENRKIDIKHIRFPIPVRREEPSGESAPEQLGP